MLSSGSGNMMGLEIPVLIEESADLSATLRSGRDDNFV
jgi:hypothetical protein